MLKKVVCSLLVIFSTVYGSLPNQLSKDAPKTSCTIHEASKEAKESSSNACATSEVVQPQQEQKSETPVPAQAVPNPPRQAIGNPSANPLNYIGLIMLAVIPTVIIVTNLPQASPPPPVCIPALASTPCLNNSAETNVRGMWWDVEYTAQNSSNSGKSVNGTCLCNAPNIETADALYAYAQQLNPNTTVCIRRNTHASECYANAEDRLKSLKRKPISKLKSQFDQFKKQNNNGRANHQLRQPKN